MVVNTDIVLKGNLIYLRYLTNNDVNETYLSWLNDDEVMAGISFESASLDTLRHYVNKQNNSPRTHFFAICDNQTNKHIGNIKLNAPIQNSEIADLGILIGDKSYWGKGIGREACKLAIEFGFTELNLKKIYLAVYENNPNAKRLYESLGFILEGVQQKHISKSGKFLDKYLYGVFKEEYDSYNTKNTSLNVQYIKDFSKEDIIKFATTNIHSDIAYDYHYTEFETKYYAVYYNAHKHLSFCIKNKNNFLLYASIYPINDKELSYFRFPVRIFLNKDFITHPLMAETIAVFKTEIENICKQFGFTSLTMYDEPLITNLFYDKITSQQTEICAMVNLKLSSDLIKRYIRKRYKSFINWGEKNLETTIYTSKNITYDIFEKFRLFHLQVAGRSTRSKESWDIQFEQIKQDKAYLIMANYMGNLAHASLFLVGEKEVEYGVGVNDRELSENQGLPISHSTMYKAIMYAKEKGFLEFNLNEINSNLEDAKYKSISFYKKGFATHLRSRTIYHIKF